MNRDIPGYYYDPDKKKYFKIEKSHTAPSSAAWSAHNVKRRKRNAADAEAKERRVKLTKKHVKRSRILRDPGLGGLLNRELGLRDPSLEGLRAAADVPAAIYAAKLEAKGKICLRDHDLPGEELANPECFWVGPTVGSTRAGTIFCSSEHNNNADRMALTPPRAYKLAKDGSLHKSNGAAGFSQGDAATVLYAHFASGASSMSYSDREDTLVLSSHLEPTRLWMVGPSGHSDQVISLSDMQNVRLPADLCINHAVAAPRSSTQLSAVIGTNAGIGLVDTRRKATFIPIINALDPDEPKPRRFDILAQSFHISNPSILYAGLRGSQAYGLDIRTPHRAITQFSHTSSVAHLSTLESNDHHLIAAGPRSAMAIYDVRCLRRQPNLRKRQATTPVLNFPSYTNDAHIQIGFAVNQGGRMVAAADSDGGVGIYSLLTGRRLSSPTLDAVRSGGVIKSLQFQTLYQERHDSLWVGLAGGVRKYSVQ